MRRRTFLSAAAAASLASFASRVENQIPEGCGTPGAPLPQPGRDGHFARWPIGNREVALEARMRAATANAPWTRTLAATDAGRELFHPTLVLERGERVDLTLANAMPDPTIVHWHGLANDTRNDGALGPPIAPGASFRYGFTIRDRAGLYWYHAHPHGATARQAYEGVFGLIEVADDEERALRRALDVVPGETEFVLVVQDRKPGGGYAASEADRVHGHFGSCITVNGVERPQQAVATRGYRLRILNASNARTLRLAFTATSGARLPFALLGTDGGLLARAVECREAFLSPAERIDVHVDFSPLAIGDAVTLETLALDPMHVENAVAEPLAGPRDGHAGHGGQGSAAAAPDPHAGHGALPEGVRAPVTTFAVRSRATSSGRVPQTLSSLPPPSPDGAVERPLRLGFSKGRWRINDRVFEMGSYPIEVARGARELWLFRNYFTSMPHAMHLHGFPMRVVARETSPEFVRALAVDDRGRLPTDLGAKDTVLVWPGETVRALLDFAHPYREPQGYLLHCHNLEHEDGGMMLGVRVA
jgi:FtsP/CotA-like multicopper oxidase with cupredoxin domain